MAKWGSADFRQFRELQERLQKLQKVDLNKFCEDVSKELAARLLALVIPRTPVGIYDGGEYICSTTGRSHISAKVEGKDGGTLRRGWTAGKTTAAGAYAKSLPIEKSGNYYIIRVINPVEYASYVEFGHRQTPGRYVPALGRRLKSGWVKGHHFLKLSEEELEDRVAPGVLDKKLIKLLQELFNG